MKVPDEDVSDEAHVCRKIPTPTTPSREEVDEHNLLGHVQYRSWCAVCVASRGVGQRHTAVEDQPSAKPMILSDYAFMRGGETKEAKAAQEAAGSMPILGQGQADEDAGSFICSREGLRDVCSKVVWSVSSENGTCGGSEQVRWRASYQGAQAESS